MKLIIARKVLPVSAPPVDHGAVCINKGLIVETGTATRLLRKYEKADVTDLRGMLVMPGLVNAHAHLELSCLHGKITRHNGFFDWIAKLIELRRTECKDSLEKAASNAIKSAIRSGTTCIGDISATELSLPALAGSGLRAVVFLEVIGLDPSGAADTVKRLRRRIAAVGKLKPGRIIAGVSPHSTYSVSGSIYDELSKSSSYSSLTIAVHLSETKDEVVHIKGESSGIDLYHGMLGWDRHPANRADSPLGLLIQKGLATRLLAVHAVHVNTNDIKRMATLGISVAHCPRSNQMLGVGSAPVAAMLKRGVNVGIGTDSLASNINMDMWDEMRFAYLVNRLSPETVIRMGTLNGALALGLGEITGSLEAGKAADLIAVRGRAASSVEPYAPLLYETRPEALALSMVGGRIIHNSSDLKA